MRAGCSCALSLIALRDAASLVEIEAHSAQNHRLVQAIVYNLGRGGEGIFAGGFRRSGQLEDRFPSGAKASLILGGIHVRAEARTLQAVRLA